MTDLEKAKAYDEALRRCKEWSEGKYGHSVDDTPKDIAEYIFPELAESDDERIRKDLIQLTYKVYANTDYLTCVEQEKMLAWLEKQGNKYDKIVEKAKSEKQRVLLTETNGKAGIDWDTRSLTDTKMLLEYGLDFINKKLEKQGEQKSVEVINIEDELNRWMGCEAFPEGVNITPLPKAMEITKRTARHFYELGLKTQQKPLEWSEEDMFDWIRKNASNYVIGEYNEIHRTVDYDGSFNADKMISNLKDYLKSLRPQKQWKPSEEQISAFE